MGNESIAAVSVLRSFAMPVKGYEFESYRRYRRWGDEPSAGLPNLLQALPEATAPGNLFTVGFCYAVDGTGNGMVAGVDVFAAVPRPGWRLKQDFEVRRWSYRNGILVTGEGAPERISSLLEEEEALYVASEGPDAFARAIAPSVLKEWQARSLAEAAGGRASYS